MSVAAAGKVLPTKIELIKTRRSLSTARRVYRVLDDKREVLLKKLEEMIQKAGTAREEIWQPISDAYFALYDSYLRLGPLRLEGIAAHTPPVVEADVIVKRIVDVDVPALKLTEKNVNMTYGFADSSVSVDKASRLIRKALVSIFKAAEFENAIFRLASELEKTQRLINALEYLIIPRYESSIRYIQATLEEREREEFVRLKHVKRVLEAKVAKSG
ncbi:MAG: V-type ATP synthase subunit D [Thaumarchaeota archaeon]|nr:V-type ATP synthase subunit D [Nitrososphaerota archaeon]MBI3023464.1 V-type ATP synthase subunit D [Nitrososphaerota archaeon]MBI3116243.1 V-type ATP synthase subunit D [Nitrososphaerota archaeon]MCS4539805.1 V-type ATP synthase subunit D [Nitrososphaerota archaeon]